MDKTIVGIDVSKDRLDVEVRPNRETFFVGRNAIGLEKLVTRMRELSPHLIALEATGVHMPGTYTIPSSSEIIAATSNYATSIWSWPLRRAGCPYASDT
jgi:hypothetical protein